MLGLPHGLGNAVSSTLSGQARTDSDGSAADPLRMVRLASWPIS
jgi:hypothetical protein